MSSVVQLHSVSTQGAAAAVRSALSLPFPHTDVGNAALFVHLHQSTLRYATDCKTWYAYEKGYWKPSADAIVQELAKGIPKYLEGAAAGNGSKDLRAWAKKTGEARRVRAIVQLASSDPAITCELADFDHDPMQLGVANGVVDLRTGAFRPAVAGDMLTLRAPVQYVAGADCPLFKRFLLDICCGDAKLMAFMLRMLAYCLTGDTREQKWFFLHGETGSNGKSTLLRVLTMLLGSQLVVTVPEGFFTAKKDGYSSSDSYVLANLARARIAVSPELGETDRLHEARMKMFTGQDSVTARAIYGTPFDYVPRFKILQLGNDIPSIYGTGDAIWRRTVLVPFNAKFKLAHEAQPGDKIRINNFEQRLAAELSGILNLLLKSCTIWQRVGLQEPPAVTAKVLENRIDQDTFGDWLSDPDQVEQNPAYKTRSYPLYGMYASWARNSGFPAMSAKNFKKQMVSRGFQHSKDKTGHWYSGIKTVNYFLAESVTIANLPLRKPLVANLPRSDAVVAALTAPAPLPSSAEAPKLGTAVLTNLVAGSVAEGKAP